MNINNASVAQVILIRAVNKTSNKMEKIALIMHQIEVQNVCTNSILFGGMESLHEQHTWQAHTRSIPIEDSQMNE